MNPAQLLAHIADDGAFLTVEEGNRLRFQGPASALTDEIREAVRQHKHEVVAFLRRSSADMSDGELAALGFVRGARGVEMLPADAAEFEGGWSPPPGWGEEARVG